MKINRINLAIAEFLARTKSRNSTPTCIDGILLDTDGTTVFTDCFYMIAVSGIPNEEPLTEKRLILRDVALDTLSIMRIRKQTIVDVADIQTELSFKFPDYRGTLACSGIEPTTEPILVPNNALHNIIRLIAKYAEPYEAIAVTTFKDRISLTASIDGQKIQSVSMCNRH